MPEVVDLVAGMSAPQANKGEDDWVWGCENPGKFTIDLTYNLICQTNDILTSDTLSAVWSCKGPNRIRLFMWLAAKEKILTNAMRVRIGLTQEASCPWCHSNEESIPHVIRDFQFALETWREMDGVNVMDSIWSIPYSEWLQFFLTSELGLQFGIVCWYLWHSRMNVFLVIIEIT
ncbi:Putative ribonuclease H protein At1g65750 [Linum perenne]